MIGKASEIKTFLVLEEGGTVFHYTLKNALERLQDCEIVNIQFTATPDSDGQAWFNALIIYKESKPSVYEERGMLSL